MDTFYRDLTKLRIRVSNKTKTTLSKDAIDFEIFKKNNEPNQNELISRILLGLDEIFEIEYDGIINKIKKQLSNYKVDIQSSLRKEAIYGYNDMKFSSLNSEFGIDQLARKIASSTYYESAISVNEKRGESKVINYKVTNETIGVIERILNRIDEREGLSTVLSKLLNDYASKPIYERERIVFYEDYNRLLDARGRTISFSTRGAINRSSFHKAVLYDVTEGLGERFNYVLCQETFQDTNETKAMSFRLARIKDVKKIARERVEFNEIVKSRLERMAEGYAEFAINEDTPILVEFKPKGETSFKAISHNRPRVVEKTELENGNAMYRFDCSEFQARIYLQKIPYGEMIIREPESLKKDVYDFHAQIYNDENC